MFGRLDGAERIIRILLDPSRLARLYGREPGSAPQPDTGADTVLNLLRGAVLDGRAPPGDLALLQSLWDKRLPAMRRELVFLDTADGLPEQLPECSAMVLERLHLDILRHELPALADAVGDDAPDLPAEQLIELFKGAKIGEERILEEAGTDRFTVMATRSAAVAVSALSGKGSGIKWLRGVFATVRTPLLVLDILVRALLKKGRVFVSLYVMAMVAAATILLASPLADAKWNSTTRYVSGFILGAGLLVLLRKHLKLLFGLVLLVMLGLLIWKGLPIIRNCLG